MSAKEALHHFTHKEPKGEIVLLIKGMQHSFTSLSPEDLVNELTRTYKISLTDAIKTAAHLLRLPKQSIYKLFHSEEI